MLSINDDIFEDARIMFDDALQGLLTRMGSRGQNCGKITLTVDLDLEHATVIDSETGEIMTEMIPDMGVKVTTSVPDKVEDKLHSRPAVRIYKDRDGNYRSKPSNDGQETFL